MPVLAMCLAYKEGQAQESRLRLYSMNMTEEDQWAR